MNGRVISRYHHATKTEYSKIYNDREMGYLGIPHLPIIIGITGPTKSGKTMVAKYLVTSHGFHYECLSSFIREKAMEFGYLNPDWQRMRDIIKQWRLDTEPAILIKTMIQKLKGEGVLRLKPKIVVDGILHPKELSTLLKLPNSHIISITASQELRFNSTNDWETNPLTWENFLLRDRWECGLRENGEKPEDTEPNINECIRLTPIENQFELFEGKGSREVLFAKIEAFIQKINVQS